jgi:hypothetical protein
VRRNLLVISCFALLGAIAAGWYVIHAYQEAGDGPVSRTPAITPPPGVRGDGAEEELVKLPETDPPPDLPITPWGKRDHFRVIRKPWFVSAEEGKKMLAVSEPVLGIVIGGEARAYSTNHLNQHEMVIDEIAGTPILVTY